MPAISSFRCLPLALIATVTLVFSITSCASVTATTEPAAEQAAVVPTGTALPPLIPIPASIERHPGQFVLKQDMPLRVTPANAQTTAIARRFIDLLARTRGIHLELRTSEATADEPTAVTLVLDPDKAQLPGGEGYRLRVDSDGIRIAAQDPRGLSYGTTTLWQLLAPTASHAPTATVANMVIDDAPRFGWRGLMLDSARHFQSVDEIKRLLDQMALHKLNTLHWHLTDDQGWRIQIKRYPKLTEVGGCRIPAGAAGRDADGQPRPYCGFYTQDEIRDVVAYAAQRYITVVPEIDLPGHAQAAIAAYPELGVTGRTPPVSPDWGVHTWLFNVEDETFVFLENVLTEVMALFPSTYIHLGGDEAVKDQWQQSARVQAKMRELGFDDEMQLQGWFMSRLGKFLQAHDRRLIGWDEILEGGPPADATVMSWRGTDGAIEAAQAGHDTVLSPSPDLYFNHIQSDAADEMPGRLEVISLKDVYEYDIVPEALTAAQARHVLGAQANLWSEYMRTGERVHRAAFPRAAALAEITWTPPARHDWDGFLQRMAADMARYRAAGFAASDSAFAVRFTAQPAGEGEATLELRNQTGFGTIRYTRDGSEPTPASPEYTRPLNLPLPSAISANAFADGRPLASPRRFTLDLRSLRTRSSNALAPCKQGLPLRLEDDAPLAGDAPEGPRAVLRTDIFDPCWVYEDAGLDGIATVSVTVGQLPYNFQLYQDADNVVTRPAKIEGGALEVRIDGCDGEPVAVLPIALARESDALTTLQAPMPALTGRHDLCFIFASGESDPMWVIDEVTLLPAE